MVKVNFRASSTCLMYSLLFVCVFTSYDWSYNVLSTQGEIFRFDKMLLFGQANIYYLFAGLFFIVLVFTKFAPNNDKNILEDRNYLKNIFWMYFVPVTILVYMAVYIKNIALEDLGIHPIIKFFVYLTVTFYIQDIFFKNKKSKQLVNILTVLEILIIFRCCYSIVKYILGFGSDNPVIGGLRLGVENDFADFFILLFIIALTRLLFGKYESKSYKILHILGIATSSCVAIFSFRRYFWGEFIVAIGLILIFHYRLNKINYYKKIISLCLFIVIILGLLLFLGPNKLTQNFYIGRLISSFSLVDRQYESQYGTEMGHRDEIKDAWYNVKKNWLLGITTFGKNKMQRFETAKWQSGLFIHNAYLQIWLHYGLLGFILFVFLYFKSLQLGYIAFFNFKNEAGVILITFMACQMIKNIVWPTAIYYMNVTIIYIFLISLVLKGQQLKYCKQG